MVETVEHLVHDAGLGLVVEMGEGKIICGSKDGKRGIEVIRSMREDEGTCVDVTEGEVEGCGCEWRRGECDRERVTRCG